MLWQCCSCTNELTMRKVSQKANQNHETINNTKTYHFSNHCPCLDHMLKPKPLSEQSDHHFRNGVSRTSDTRINDETLDKDPGHNTDG